MKRNLLQRIHAVMADVHYVQKDTSVSMGKGSYKAVSHDAVTAKVRDAMVKHGVVCFIEHIQVEDDELEFENKFGKRRETRTKIKGAVKFCNIDDPMDVLTVEAIGYGLDSGDKSPGKAISYMFKYALLKTFMLETGEDSDKEASKPRTTAPQKVAQRKPEVNKVWSVQEKKRMFEQLKGINTEAAERIKKIKGLWDDPTWDQVNEIIERTIQ